MILSNPYWTGSKKVGECMDNNGGRFRKKRVNFSMVSNRILRDETISLKAKGLYALIQSYITLDDFILYKNFLQKKCCEGKKSFETAWKELKDTGYLLQYRMKDEKNHFYYEYELLDEPEPPVPQNGGTENPVPLFGYIGKGVQHKTDTPQKGGSINNTKKNNISKNNIISNHIISVDEIMAQIEYDGFPEIDLPYVDNIIMIMLDIINLDDDAQVRVNNITMRAGVVKSRFAKINHEHVGYIIFSLNDMDGKIGNIRNYMITALYNAPSTMDIYFHNKVMQQYN